MTTITAGLLCRDHSGRHKINKEPIIYAFGLTHGLPSHYWRLFESAPCLSPNCSHSKKEADSWAINGGKSLVEYNFSVKSISRKISWKWFHGKFKYYLVVFPIILHLFLGFLTQCGWQLSKVVEKCVFRNAMFVLSIKAYSLKVAPWAIIAFSEWHLLPKQHLGYPL